MIRLLSKKLKKSWDDKVRERYEILRKIYQLYRKYHSLKGIRKISITPFESHYAEYLVAQKLIDEGFTIEGMYGKGYDVRCNNKKIEVKSGRLQRHVRGIKHDFWGWVVKEKQWNTPDPFDYLVCVALEYYEDRDGILVFPYKDVRENFTKCGWKYLRYNTTVENYLRLNLVKDGYEAFLENTEVMKKKIGFKGEITKFERKLNKNPDQVFLEFSWQNFIKNLRLST